MVREFFVSLIALFLGLLVGAAVMLFGGYNPLEAYRALFWSVLTSPYQLGEMLRESTPLLLTGISVALAYRAGLFNIGAAGQMYLGGVAAAWVGIAWELPPVLHAGLAVTTAALAGALWGALAGYLKAWRGVHEVISTIMLNWTALYLGNGLIRAYLLDPNQRQRSHFVAASATLDSPTLASLFGQARLGYGFVLALLALVVYAVLLEWHTLGFALRASGLSPGAARYAGIPPGRSIVLAMGLAGAFAGVAGATEVLGVFHYMGIAAALPNAGFDGIAVALLGGNTAPGILLAGLFFGLLNYGAGSMQFVAGVPLEAVRIVVAAVLFFVAVRYVFERWVGVRRPAE